MKSFEALFTLLLVLSFSLLVLQMKTPALDDTLYRYQVANDVWRVWWLRGDLEGWNGPAMQKDAERMGQLTGWCVQLEEEDIANCRGGEMVIAIQKRAWMKNGIENLTLTISKAKP